MLASVSGWRIGLQPTQLELRYRNLITPAFFLGLLPLFTLMFLGLLMLESNIGPDGASILVLAFFAMAGGSALAWVYAPQYLLWQKQIVLDAAGNITLTSFYVRRTVVDTYPAHDILGFQFATYRHSDWIWPRHQLLAVPAQGSPYPLFPADNWESFRTATRVREALAQHILEHDLPLSLGHISKEAD